MQYFVAARLVSIFFFIYNVVESDNAPTSSSVSRVEVSQEASLRRADEVSPETSPRICDANGKGLLFPMYADEYQWGTAIRALCYAVGLIYCFMGVSIIADIFMSSIEEITRRRRQDVDGQGKVTTVYCWNDTVANLSLMALGSSAPEIFLSIIDVVRKEMYAGDLGPSTIVGSAAFNLLVIVAVCVMCIPYPDSRKIEQMEVFILTAIFSVVAYLWMGFILIFQSPDEVEWWEALITLLFLPVLIWTAYRVDIKGWAGLGLDKFTCFREPGGAGGRNSARSSSNIVQANSSAASGTMSIDSSGLGQNEGFTDHESDNNKVKTMTPRGGRANAVRHKTIAAHHMVAMMKIRQSRVSTVSGVGSQVSMNSTVGSQFSGHSAMSIREKSMTDPNNKFASLTRDMTKSLGRPPSYHFDVDDPIVQLLVDRQVMHGEISQKVLTVCCRGEASSLMRIHYKVELLAQPHSLPAPHRGAYDIQDRRVNEKWPKPSIAKILGFGQVDLPAGTLTKDFMVDTPKGEDGACMDFLVTLRGTEVQMPMEGGDAPTRFRLGPITTTQVDVRPWKDPGYLAFISQSITVPGRDDDYSLHIVVLRKGGCTGTLSCTYCLEPLDAVPDYDYQDSNGLLIFGEGVTEQLIEVDICGKSRTRGAYKFLIVLKASVDTCKFDPDGDGGEDSSTLTITVAAREEGHRTFGRMIDKVFNLGKCKMATSDWKDQIISTPYCNGSAEEQKEASVSDWIFHILMLPWKSFFLVVPPASYGGGWVCFTVSLIVIGIVTAIIADFAELFGCILDIGDMVTAITFVALGTSMPDLFASKVAAMEDPTADASIVNVTGSNAVNVFLGLGVPWTASTIYWAVRGDLRSEWAGKYPEMAEIHKSGCVFVVRSGNLGFCVTIFSCFALLALAILLFRRKALDCELGGPSVPKVFTTLSFVSMWIGYIFLASWRYARWDIAGQSEVMAVMGITALLEMLLAFAVLGTSLMADMTAYREEKAIYDEEKEMEAKREAEKEIKLDEGLSAEFIKGLAGSDNTHFLLQSRGSMDFPDDVGDDQTASMLSLTYAQDPSSSQGLNSLQLQHQPFPRGDQLTSTSSFVTDRGSFQSERIPHSEGFQSERIPISEGGLRDGAESDGSPHESPKVSSSLAKVISQPVPTESKAMWPKGLMESSLLVEGIGPTIVPSDYRGPGAGPSKHQPHFGPKLVPK